MELTIDTSWWTRYRSRHGNPDTGGTFAQAVPGLMRGRFPAIPRSDADLKPAKHLQAIANTAGFHFATIEQGGTSLYPAVAQRVNDPEALRVVLSIGPTEAMHFQTWSDKAGNAPPLTDPTNGLVFPDLNKKPFDGQNFQTNLIMPEPTNFLSRKFPVVSIVRPNADRPRLPARILRRDTAGKCGKCATPGGGRFRGTASGIRRGGVRRCWRSSGCAA